jgi:hypothetical protein
VTYAAHYPVGYPAILGVAYALFGAEPSSAMLVNALFGALMVPAAYFIATSVGAGRLARWVGLALAVHPTLVLYTAALMTEGLSASLFVLLSAFALWLSQRQSGWMGRLVLGILGGLLVLVRPQLLPALPALGSVAVATSAGLTGWRELWLRGRGGAQVLAVGLLVCLPWTLRNCAKMDGCVFVSANGGWNLLIGTLPEGRGSFAPIDGATVPIECRNVFGEAGKDRCFGQAGMRRIRSEPVAWLALAPQKLGQLFNHGAVASAYLRTSNGSLVTEVVRQRLATLETVCTRLFLLGACWGLGRAARRGRLVLAFALAAGAFSLSPWGYAAELCLFGGLLALRPTPGRRPLLFLAAVLLGLSCFTHTLFFGAPRYALVWLPWLALLWTLARAPTGPNAERARVF